MQQGFTAIVSALLDTPAPPTEAMIQAARAAHSLDGPFGQLSATDERKAAAVANPAPPPAATGTGLSPANREIVAQAIAQIAAEEAVARNTAITASWRKAQARARCKLISNPNPTANFGWGAAFARARTLRGR